VSIRKLWNFTETVIPAQAAARAGESKNINDLLDPRLRGDDEN
jgi:hypothetical protein